ncbi:signal peptide peptidase SppA [Mycobacterium sp. ACS4331]|uniref:signal peptide peptidase SppA n=1 Tax=Mycobacterium sp. ACS4331 TaxID=1834121 RepID=UPI0007FC82BC|nr:signal peptide peptidase SppA [Mycobacterium sp. ACS4331]OBF26172.1 signal peptide peptidase SppA [Mycobacterium sp. ACS4331]
MFSFLPGVPGPDDVRALVRRVDTARHHGVPDKCVLELDLQHAPPETLGFDPLAMLSAITGADRPLTLRETVAAIHRAADDDRVAGLIARVQMTAAPPGAVQELREAIIEFTAKKPSLAWAETYPGTLSYHLASAFGEVWMQPSGTVGLIGFATSPLFLRDAFDKAGIEAQFIARGEYKSAANIFTEDGYTEAHREADARMVESLAAQVWEAVAAARGLDVATVNALADRAPLLRDDAVAAGLVDRIGFRDEAYARIAELVGAEGVPPDGEDAPPRLYLARYARTGRPELPKVPVPGRRSPAAVAVVTVAGQIVSGRGGRQMFPIGSASAGGDTIAAALREAVADDRIAAIVLRVDSPGGSVSGSETIWREVVRAREAGKPVVASMGSVAASGGYYVSMAADEIVANPGTITGSIGVITGKLIARDLKDRLGVGFDVVRTNDNADAWSVNAPFTDQQRERVEAETDLLYSDFIDRVAEGRGMTVESVHEVARGRVWTGADAHEHGLVDELGGLRTAVRRAKILAGLDPDVKAKVVSFPGSSVREMLRPKPSSRPAASLSEAAAAVVVRGLAAGVDSAQRQLTGVNALWLGERRY